MQTPSALPSSFDRNWVLRMVNRCALHEFNRAELADVPDVLLQDDSVAVVWDYFFRSRLYNYLLLYSEFNPSWEGDYRAIPRLFWPHTATFNRQLQFVGLRYLAWAHTATLIDGVYSCSSLDFALVALYADLALRAD